jgi:hypothetical protein
MAAASSIKECFRISILPSALFAQAIHGGNLTRWSDIRLLQLRERYAFWVRCANNVTKEVGKYRFPSRRCTGHEKIS